MATLGRSSWGNDPAAWDLAKQLQAQGIDPTTAISMVDRALLDNANAQMAIRGASNPQPGQSFDVVVDRGAVYSQIDELAPDGTQRRVQEIRLNNLVRMQSAGGKR